MDKAVTIETISACKSMRMQITMGNGDAELVLYGENNTFCGCIYLDNDELRQFCQKVIQELDDYDPTPCCHQHHMGLLSSKEPCLEIADND